MGKLEKPRATSYLLQRLSVASVAWECCSNLRLHPIQLTFILLLLNLFIYSCIELCIVCVLYCIAIMLYLLLFAIII